MDDENITLGPNVHESLLYTEILFMNDILMLPKKIHRFLKNFSHPIENYTIWHPLAPTPMIVKIDPILYMYKYGLRDRLRHSYQMQIDCFLRSGLLSLPILLMI